MTNKHRGNSGPELFALPKVTKKKDKCQKNKRVFIFRLIRN